MLPPRITCATRRVLVRTKSDLAPVAVEVVTAGSFRKWLEKDDDDGDFWVVVMVEKSCRNWTGGLISRPCTCTGVDPKDDSVRAARRSRCINVVMTFRSFDVWIGYLSFRLLLLSRLLVLVLVLQPLLLVGNAGRDARTVIPERIMGVQNDFVANIVLQKKNCHLANHNVR